MDRLRAVSAALVEHCLELFAPLGAVRVRRMFGGHGFYVDDLFFALIAFERLFLKADRETRAQFESAGCEPFVYDGRGRAVTMSYWTVPADALESPTAMVPWARLAVAAALRARHAKADGRARPARSGAVKPAARRAARPASKPRGGAG